MDTARWVVGVLLLVGLPPGLALWFFIHPFARHWRRLGVGWTYAILSLPTALLMFWTWSSRSWLMGSDGGGSPALAALAVACGVAAAILAVKRRRYLTSARLVGVPELSTASYPGELLTEGPYARIRHPRYVEVVLASAAYALFSNHTGPYWLVMASLPTMHLLVLLEERELRERFGSAYDEYAARVPRYVPRPGMRHSR